MEEFVEQIRQLKFEQVILKCEQGTLKEKVGIIEEDDNNFKEFQRKLVKLPIPLRFKGTSSLFDSQVVQVCNYTNYYNAQFEDEEGKVIFAGVFLDRVAAKWFELYARRNLEEIEVTLKEIYPVISVIFGNFDEFVKAITLEFGEFDGERRAEQRLLNI